MRIRRKTNRRMVDGLNAIRFYGSGAHHRRGILRGRECKEKRGGWGGEAVQTEGANVMGVFLGLFLLSTLTCALAKISLDMRVTPSVVDPTKTKNVTVSCVAVQYDYEKKENISSLRIFKNYETGWRLVAQITDLEPNDVYVTDESITSQTGNIIRQRNIVGRLAISWYPASSDTLGQYKCLSSSYTTTQNQIYTKMTTISLGSQLDALAVLRLMKNDRDEVTEKLAEITEKAERYQEDLQKSVDEDLASLKGELINLESELNETLINQDNQFGQLKEEIVRILEKSNQENVAKLEELDKRMQKSLDRGFLLLWPRGTYALPKPTTGCPSSAGVAWEKGWRKQHTESVDRNKDQVSEGNHLAAPVRLIDPNQNNYVYQRFCVKTDSVSPGPTWPTGTYCISKRGQCPAFFKEGSIKWDEHTSGGLSASHGVLPDGQYSMSNTTIVYCCRDDGPADEPIYLPRAQPFYLYRHGGQCQQVDGMSVSEETIRFDTQKINNGDAATGKHPDVLLNNVVIYLCYYEQE
ncbi:hypothetical protein RRG08_032230 [Elysia crispata]|uniref:Apextrin C-terminal domain-containing protein n=1 Tax=Elysia crispata TaxID=231223 RepID=A0AAE1AZC2_9GAST|nr:hypothetical protein RRG08_032230 [Elysia crispata]